MGGREEGRKRGPENEWIQALGARRGGERMGTGKGAWRLSGQSV